MAIAIFPILVFSQETDKYSSLYEGYFRGEELYSNLQYGAAKKEFRDFITRCDNYNDPLFQKALYYEGMAGLELYWPSYGLQQALPWKHSPEIHQF